MTDGLPSPYQRGEPAEATAGIDFQVGPVRLRARAAISPEGLIAVGALVSSILLSSAVIVWASAAVRRR
jgi:hypothetical protein